MKQKVWLKGSKWITFGSSIYFFLFYLLSIWPTQNLIRSISGIEFNDYLVFMEKFFIVPAETLFGFSFKKCDVLTLSAYSKQTLGTLDCLRGYLWPALLITGSLSLVWVLFFPGKKFKK